VQAGFVAVYGDRAERNPDHTSIVGDRHAERLRGLLDEARAKGAEATPCGVVGDMRRMRCTSSPASHPTWRCCATISSARS
jgi:coniferyl-aldehyde dehydrogenase